MKIALFVHCFFPNHYFGTEAYTLTLAKELIALGHRPSVVSATFQGEPRQTRFVEAYEWDGVPVLSLDKNAVPHRSVGETYDQPVMRWAHERVLRHLQPDIVHVCHLINHTAALLDTTRAMKLPTFATLTDFFGFCLTNKLEAADGSLCAGPNPARSNCIACHLKASATHGGTVSRVIGSAVARPLSSRLLAWSAKARPEKPVLSLRPADIVRRPDRLHEALSVYREAIAPSAFLRDAYAANGFPAKLRSSHFGIDIDRRPKPPRADPSRIRIGYIGQIEPHKGVDVLLRALRMADRPTLGLTIWGDEGQNRGHAAELRRLADGLDVTFAGTFGRDRTADIMTDIDVLAIPSTWYENSPLILLQALATHTPVIVSDVAGLTEFIDEGRSGFAFPRGDDRALSQLLIRLAGTPDQVTAMSLTTSYDRTLRTMAEDVVAMYREHGITGQDRVSR